MTLLDVQSSAGHIIGLWKNVTFPLKCQNLHIHSKFIVQFSPILAYKFVYLVGTWYRERFWEFFNFENFLTHFDFKKKCIFSKFLNISCSQQSYCLIQPKLSMQVCLLNRRLMLQPVSRIFDFWKFHGILVFITILKNVPFEIIVSKCQKDVSS